MDDDRQDFPDEMRRTEGSGPDEPETIRETGGEAATDATPETAGRIGAYRILKELGRGGQGRVYQAIDERLGRLVALKVLDHSTPEAIGRFSREAAATSRLDHPGISAVYEVGADRGRSFIAMRHVDGESLAARLASARREVADLRRTPSV